MPSKHIRNREKGTQSLGVTPTLQKCYQIPDEATMESVVLRPKRLRLVG
jgi:hypothetical protein